MMSLAARNHCTYATIRKQMKQRKAKISDDG